MKKTKVQTATISIPANSQPARRDFKVTLDSEFDYSTAYYALVDLNGGLTRQWKIGVKDDTNTYLDLVNGKHLVMETSVATKDRWVSQIIRAKGRNVFVTVETYEPTTSELSFDLLFHLVKGEVNCDTPKPAIPAK